jgi:hypothetical protein
MTKRFIGKLYYGVKNDRFFMNNNNIGCKKLVRVDGINPDTRITGREHC